MQQGSRMCIELKESKKVVENVLNSEQGGNDNGWGVGCSSE